MAIVTIAPRSCRAVSGGLHCPRDLRQYLDGDLRENPGDGYRRNATLRDGTVMRITGGPTCSDDMEWWQVRTLDGLGGWISEGDEAAYWIEPWPISMDVVRATA